MYKHSKSHLLSFQYELSSVLGHNYVTVSSQQIFEVGILIYFSEINKWEHTVKEAELWFKSSPLFYYTSLSLCQYKNKV